MKVALDTTYILGRGAVKDTYNLLSDGIVNLVRALSEVEKPHLVLLDLMLPGIDGGDLMQSIRAAGDVPVIFVSAYG